VQITSEMREVPLFRRSQLVVVDHPVGTEAHTTSKMRPGKPFPPSEIVTLHHRQALQHATLSDGMEDHRIG